MTPGRRRNWLVLLACLLLLLLGLAAIPLMNARRAAPALAEADLGDGRILQIEAVTFGTRHQVGYESAFLQRFGSWLPAPVRAALAPRIPRSSIERSEPVLVVWVNALHSTLRTNVDCQGVRLEFIDEQGTVYGNDQRNWFGADRFWRVGHVFGAFPRQSRTLDLKVTPWKSTNTVSFKLPNPGYTEPARWTGKPLPQRHRQGDYEVVLSNLTAITNTGTYWKPAMAFWKPEFEILHDGNEQPAGWDIEWTAEDAYGNRGQELGLAQPILKFTVDSFPSATNTHAAVLITNLPLANLSAVTNTWWNTTAMVTSNRVEILGLFPAGVHTFSEGDYLTNPPMKFGPVQGGAPSGWVGSSRQTPTRTIAFHGHYSDVPVIYVRVSDPKSKQRIAMRLRDPHTGALFPAQPEPQGSRDKVLAFLVRTPAAVTNAIAELVLLPPIHAEYYVDMAAFKKAAGP